MGLDKKTIKLFEDYKGKLEDMFDVDLSDLKIKPFNKAKKEIYDYFKTITRNLLSAECKPEGLIDKIKFETRFLTIKTKTWLTAKKSISDSVDIGKAVYHGGTNTIYMRKNDSSCDFYTTLVHELAHAVDFQIKGKYLLEQSLKNPSSESRLKNDWGLGDGFAEYVSKFLFADHYGIEGIVEFTNKEKEFYLQISRK